MGLGAGLEIPCQLSEDPPPCPSQEPFPGYLPPAVKHDFIHPVSVVIRILLQELHRKDIPRLQMYPLIAKFPGYMPHFIAGTGPGSGQYLDAIDTYGPVFHNPCSVKGKMIVVFRKAVRGQDREFYFLGRMVDICHFPSGFQFIRVKIFCFQSNL